MQKENNRSLIYEATRSVMFGHAVGDALGVPVEFSSREELKRNPVTGMRGFGTYPVPEGCWSDDTSMALATLDSLKKGSIDYRDIMYNFAHWYTDGEYTPTGELFDIGVAFVSGLIVVPAVFAVFGADESRLTSGSGLLFETLPVVFARMPFGKVIGTLFFVLVFFAAISSAISMMEVNVANIIQRFGLKRWTAVGIMAVILLLYKPVVTALRKARLLPESHASAQSAKSRNVGFLLFSLALLATFVVLALVLMGIL